MIASLRFSGRVSNVVANTQPEFVINGTIRVGLQCCGVTAEESASPSRGKIIAASCSSALQYFTVFIQMKPWMHQGKIELLYAR